MGSFQYNLNDYIVYVFASRNKRLLVEGDSEYRLFNSLFNSMKSLGQSTEIEIDDASCLIDFGVGVGNREKVETTCAAIKNEPFADKLVGFVDREFRDFNLLPNIVDNLRKHKVLDRLIWSRGHSLENYLFDFQTLNEPALNLSTTRYISRALNLFEKNFEGVIKSACLVSLLGIEIANYEIVRSNISWKMFTLHGETVFFEFDTFLQSLRTKKVPLSKINTINSFYPDILQRVSNLDFETARWLCHGHIGTTFLWESLKGIVYEVSKQSGSQKPASDVAKTLEAKDEIKLNVCGQKWIARSLEKRADFPFEILDMLDLHI